MSQETSLWYLAQVKPNSLKIAQRNLTRQGVTTFVPVEETTRKRNGQFYLTQTPLFPGYIFVSWSEKDNFWRKVNSTYGVSKLVSFGTTPAHVPGEFIAELRGHCDSNGMVMRGPRLKSGEDVAVTRGPFTDALGKILEIAPDQRAWVLMDIMGRQTRVSIDTDDLRRR